MMMFLDDQIKFCFSVWRWFSGGINSRWWHPEHTNSSFSSGCSQLSQSIFSTWRNIYRSMCSDDRIGRLFWGCRIRNHRWRKDLHNVIPGHRDSSVSGVPVSILPITNTQPTVVRRYIIVHTVHIYPPWYTSEVDPTTHTHKYGIYSMDPAVPSSSSNNNNNNGTTNPTKHKKTSRSNHQNHKNDNENDTTTNTIEVDPIGRTYFYKYIDLYHFTFDSRFDLLDIYIYIYRHSTQKEKEGSYQHHSSNKSNDQSSSY